MTTDKTEETWKFKFNEAVRTQTAVLLTQKCFVAIAAEDGICEEQKVAVDPSYIQGTKRNRKPS